MKKIIPGLAVICSVFLSFSAGAQEKTVKLTLEDALKIALSENVSVKVADMEIERSEYAK